jgi:transcriptional regulator with XRE-family HTH domain
LGVIPLMPDKALTADGPDPFDEALGTRIRRVRRSLTVSQTALAERLGISFQQVKKYEHGVDRVSASMLVRIAAQLDTTVAALVGEDTAILGAPTRTDTLGTAGAAELLAAFVAIKNGEVRRAVVTIAQTLARDQDRKLRQNLRH